MDNLYGNALAQDRVPRFPLHGTSLPSAWNLASLCMVPVIGVQHSTSLPSAARNLLHSINGIQKSTAFVFLATPVRGPETDIEFEFGTAFAIIGNPQIRKVMRFTSNPECVLP